MIRSGPQVGPRVSPNGRHAIASVRARRIWDSRGRPTIEVDVVTRSGVLGRSSAPAGASTGSGEASDLRDGGTGLKAWDVGQAIDGVTQVIAPALMGIPVTEQETVDGVLDGLDPTAGRQRLGGNATTAVSLAVLNAASHSLGRPTWELLGRTPVNMPRPEIQMLGGGAHATQATDIQDFLIVPMLAVDVADVVWIAAEVYYWLGHLLKKRGLHFGVADEGGYWPSLPSNRAHLDILVEAITFAGLRPGIDVGISLDIAATQLSRAGRYTLASESREFAPEDWVATVIEWVREYPIVAIEDPVAEDDARGMRSITDAIGDQVLVIADDFVVTSADRIRSAADEGAGNAALIKVNQAGTVTAAFHAVNAAVEAGWAVIVSGRSGETEDVSMAHLAVGWSANLAKVGSVTRSERTAKWNELIRISERLDGLPLAPLRPAPPPSQSSPLALRTS